MSPGQDDLLQRAWHTFTPGAPINRRALFAGREAQIGRIADCLNTPGRHPVIYGNRGVGKTSLANILEDSGINLVAVKVSCDGSDNFSSIWNRAFRQAPVAFKERAFGFSAEEATKVVPLSSYLGDDSSDVTPARIAEVLARIQYGALFILDEFDKVGSNETKAQVADLIKITSDTCHFVTIVPVGVSASIRELVGEHPSVNRNLVHVELPVMSDAEISDVYSVGCKSLGLEVEDAIVDEVAQLSAGYPHYAHLLGLHTAKACAANATSSVGADLFHFACNLAIEDAIEKYRDSYTLATRTTKVSKYPLVLCACAHAHSDESGVFRATEVVDALKRVFNLSTTVPAVVPALSAFTNSEKGGVLIKVPVANRTHYQFSDPMMRPFLLIKTQELL